MKTGWIFAAVMAAAMNANAEVVTYGFSGKVTSSDGQSATVGDDWSAEFSVDYGASPYYSDEYSTHYECIENLKTTVGGQTFQRTDPWELQIKNGSVGFAEAPVGNDRNLYIGFLPVDPRPDDSLEAARDLDSTTKWSAKRWAMDVWDSTWEGVRTFSSFAGDVTKAWVVDPWTTRPGKNKDGYSDGTIKDGYPPGSDM